MIKELKYGGLTASPLDYECSDGDLAISMDMIPEDGSLKPVIPPRFVVNFGVEYNLLHIHEGTGYKNYIMQKGQDVYSFPADYVYEDGGDNRVFALSGLDLLQVASIGNTVVLLTSGGVSYLLWSDGGYKVLGSSMPELRMSFGLTNSAVVTSDPASVNYDSHAPYSKNSGVIEFSDANKLTITNAVLAQVNKFIAEAGGQRFLMPFFVRYAYRLYDGSLTRHSAPIFMVCDTGSTPSVGVTRIYDKDGDALDTFYTNTPTTRCTFEVYGLLHDLDYAVNAGLNDLKDWKDIITSIDVFVSPPIYRIDINGKCKSFGGRNSEGVKRRMTICKTTGGTYYQQAEVEDLNDTDYLTHLYLPIKPLSDYVRDIEDNSLFYLLKSIPVDELKESRTVIDIPQGYLSSLVVRETMTDDYDSHENLIAENAFVYNNRLNLGGISKKLFPGFTPSSLFCYSNKPISSTDTRKYSIEITTFVKTPDGQQKVMKSLGDIGLSPQTDGGRVPVGGSSVTVVTFPIYYLYYPSASATKVFIKIVGNGNIYEGEVALTAHAMLNGAHYFNIDGVELKKTSVETINYESPSLLVELPHKLYTSEVNNPFKFPVTGINTIGTGRILGISSAAKALSEGQFGQFPLYAFTTDGVWALEVSGTGTFTARQPVTRDICVNPGSITQIDSAVLFVTDRGIMLLAGSEATCISEIIDGALPDMSAYPSGASLLKLSGIDTNAFAFASFREFISGCQMFYDYTHQRIVVFNPSYAYAYVYSLKSKSWGMMSSQMATSANAYPETAVQLHDGSIVDYAGEGDYDELHGFILSRPLKLDGPDILKTVYSIIQRGNFNKGDIKVALFGSRDLANWHYVYSSADHYLRGFAGTPYKYYRIGVMSSLKNGKGLFGCSINYESKQGNDLR